MSDKSEKDKLDTLGAALDRLKEAIGHPIDKDRLAIDATIQRFEFTFELFWKALKKSLQKEGIEAASPKACLKGAFQMGWIEDEQFWLEMLENRNLTSHTYKEDTADLVYSHIKNYEPKIREVYELLSKMAK